uniref:tRNA(Ile)-lysidine synthase n=1 Tax=Agarophyton chilense TaxID=2510777 RepID=A0A141SEN8_AGACH|nr:tRNA(Ile)-lysidine synthase [Agarophyton chilense]AMK96756.1 tRNA(Ile)-lysidine synthase [Agarophyton chilense]ASP44651.1 tRNA(Ile)-lysidine synthase [Agarophyton chilense]UAD84315.1 tRNAIle-lysidine synthetase [Agarophyton chilense]
MTNTYLHNKFISIMLKYKDLIKPLSILIALSGGKDSLCLIRLIEDFNNKYDYFTKVEYIYIDHQWRSDSKQNIEHLLNYISITNNHTYIYQISKIGTSESTMRNMRYQTIVKHAIQNRHQIIMTGHNQTDQIETFLLNLIRGTGLEGLSSLPYMRKITDQIQVIRPMIQINTGDILWFCRKFNLPIWSDKTNFYYTNCRNRIRYELVPYLKEYFNPKIESNIINFLHLSSTENEYIKQNSIKLYLASRHSRYIAINYRIIKNQHLALQKRVLNIFFYYNFNKYLSTHIFNQLTTFKYQKKLTIVWETLKIKVYKNWIYIQ